MSSNGYSLGRGRKRKVGGKEGALGQGKMIKISHHGRFESSLTARRKTFLRK